MPPPCFDPEIARGPLLRVPVAALVDPLPVTHAGDRVLAYRAAMEAGERFPPVSVLPVLGRLWIADGHKRFAACRTLTTEIDVEVWSYGRWLADQGRQAAGTGRRLLRAVSLLGRRPGESWALFSSAPRHWWRVARSLAGHAAAGIETRRPRRDRAG